MIGVLDVLNMTTTLLRRIVRFLDHTRGCDLANMRPIDNVCYDLQTQSHTAIGLLAGGRPSYDWSYAW